MQKDFKEGKEFTSRKRKEGLSEKIEFLDKFASSTKAEMKLMKHLSEASIRDENQISMDVLYRARNWSLAFKLKSCFTGLGSKEALEEHFIGK